MSQTAIFPEVIKTLVSVIEEKDEFVRGHSVRVGQSCVRMAKRLNFPKPEQDKLFLAGLLHDIGMVYVPSELLAKEDKLTDEEMEIIKKHPVVAEKILSHLTLIHPILPLIRHHHERYDGSGYPDGLRGTAIPLGARIIAIADCFDALLCARPHRPGKSITEALAEMQRQVGTQFDPSLLKLFISLVGTAPAATTVEPVVSQPESAEAGNVAGTVSAIIAKVKAGKIEMPVLPSVVMEIQRVIKNPIATTNDLAAAIEKDAVISLKLITTANSSLYRGAKKVLTVREAVPRLGLKQTQSVVNAIANRGLYETTHEEFVTLMGRLWNHALATAYGARALAKLAGREDFEYYFTYGLVHDIGKVLMMRALLAKSTPELTQLDASSMVPLLQQVHTEFGAMLLEAWGFPPEFKNVALLHEDSSYSTTTPPEVLIVNLANLVTRTIGLSLLSENGSEPAASASAKLLGIDGAAIAETAAEVQKIMQSSAQAF